MHGGALLVTVFLVEAIGIVLGIDARLVIPWQVDRDVNLFVHLISAVFLLSLVVDLETCRTRRLCEAELTGRSGLYLGSIVDLAYLSDWTGLYWRL